MTKLQARVTVRPTSPRTKNGRRWYCRAITKAERDRRAEVLAAHTTYEAGIVKPGDPVEGRRCRSTELLERKMKKTLNLRSMKETPNSRSKREKPNSRSISTKLKQIAKRAKEMPGVALKTLAHHIDIEWLRKAFERTRKDGAVGIDGQSAQDYEENLEDNLGSLLDRAKSGTYRAPPVRRVYIPKADGNKRPIGIPTLEDKVLQRAVTMVLEAVYEQDFLDCSHGFRPGRSAHEALETLRHHSMQMQGGWVLEADIKSFFDSVDHATLRAILTQRIRDGVLVRLIGKWLKAGVLEQGCIYHSKTGTPQGGVISPMLANIFLHEVVDVWFEEQVKPRMKGKAHLVRYADDLVMMFERVDDARRVYDVLPKRLGKYGLSLHPEKTRLVRFRRPEKGTRPKREERPETFTFLGFTHYWGISKKGNWVFKRKTASSRFSRTMRRISEWCRKNMHLPISVQHEKLTAMLQGHDAYFGIKGNGAAVYSLRHWVERCWRKWLSRRSRKAYITWEKMKRILARFPLPKPRIRPLRAPRVANP